jgi:surface antigen
MGRARHPIASRAAAALLCTLAFSGCSYKLGSLIATDDEPQSTGSINRPALSASQSLSRSSPQAELDFAYARAAAAEALSRGSKEASVPWQNPQTGARGNITPLATSYSEAGMACRDFLASYIHGELQDWLEGAACRTASGNWQVKRLKPLNSG